MSTITGGNHASPYSTGGGGTTLEHRYGAVLMSHVLSGHPIDVLGDDFTPTHVHFQAAKLSPVDDYVVAGYRADGAVRHVAIAVRRMPNVVKSSEETVRLVGTFIDLVLQRESDLDSDSWRIGLAADRMSDHARELETLTGIARSSLTDEEFRTSLGRKGRTTRSVRARMSSFDNVIEEAAGKIAMAAPLINRGLAWRLLRATHVHFLDLEGATAGDRAVAIGMLQGLPGIANATKAADAFRRLSELSADYAAAAATRDIRSITRDLGWLVQRDASTLEIAYAQRVKTSVANRRSARRSFLGLSPQQLEASFRVERPLPLRLQQLGAGDLLVLKAPLGSGKTDIAERWLLEAADRFLDGGSSALPVWLSADEVDGAVQAAVERELVRSGRSAEDDLDVALVLDGLDERASGAESLLIDARAMVMNWPACSVVLTARQNVVVPDDISTTIQPLEEKDAVELMARVAGQDLSLREWPASLKDAVGRPLFALIAGKYANSAGSRSRLGLVRKVVEEALRESSTGPELRSLAVALTRAGKPIDPLTVARTADMRSLRASRLVIFDNNRCHFVLPIFEQWFAAEAVLAGEVPLGEITSDLVAFGKWRYVLPVCLSSGTRETVDPVMNHLARWNPGAAGWLVDESISSGLSSSEEVDSLDSWRSEGQRLWSAAEAFALGLGPAANLVRPVSYFRSAGQDDPLENIALRVAVKDRIVVQQWRIRERNEAPVQRFVRISPPESPDPQELRTLRASAPEDENWPWRWTLDELKEDLAEALTKRANVLELLPEGVIRREDDVWLASAIVRSVQVKPEPRDEAALLDAIRKILDGVSAPERTLFRLEGASVPGGELLQLQRHLEAGGKAYMSDIWPGPDLKDWTSGWVWGNYSTNRMLERVKAVYGGAMDAYQELHSSLFANFGLTLSHAALLPGRVVGEFRYEPGEDLDRAPSLAYSIHPETRGPDGAGGERVEVTCVEELTWSIPDDGYFSNRMSDFDNRPEAALFGRVFYSHVALDIFGSRPATMLALEWLRDDLEKIGWLSHSGPKGRLD
jgi:hypothetical protein